jgi:hypothetical protein
VKKAYKEETMRDEEIAAMRRERTEHDNKIAAMGDEMAAMRHELQHLRSLNQADSEVKSESASAN